MAQCLGLAADAEQTVKNTSRASSQALGYVALGEALWENDRERARGHLRRAFEAVTQVPLDESWPDRHGPIPDRNPINLFPAIIERITRLDPDLAYELTRSFGQTREDGTVAFRKEDGAFRRNRAMSAVAGVLVEKDPARASAIATEVMERDIESMVGVLFQLRLVDRTKADQLALAALDLIVRRQPPNLVEFYSLGSYVFPRTRLPLAVVDEESEKLPVNGVLAARFLPAFLSAVQQRVLAGPSPGEPEWVSFSRWYSALLELRPYVPQYAPAIEPVYDAFVTQVANKLSEKQRRAHDEFQQRMKDPGSQSLDDLLAQAYREASPQRRDRMLAGAVQVATETKSYDRIEAILSQIGDLEIRQNMSELYHFRATEHYAGSGDIIEARRHAATLKKPELMVLAFAAMAETRQQPDAGEAQSYLAEAERLFATLPDSAEKARAHLRLAAAFAPHNPAYASQLTRTALIQMGKMEAQLDDLTGVTIKLDTVQGVIAEKGSLRLGAGDLTTTLDQLMNRLATDDFEGTLVTLAQVGRGEVKLMAELVMVREGFRWIKSVRPKLEAASLAR
jgi:hypothetical protein